MKKNITADKQHAHHLLDRLDASQLPTAVRFLEFMLLDPVSRALATAPYDDELLSDAGRRAIDEASEWLKHNKGIPHEEVLAEFGLTMEDFEKMGETPLTEKSPSKTKPRRNGAKRLVWTDQANPRHRPAARLAGAQTLARFLKSGEGDTKQLRGYDPPLFRLRAQDYRVFFRDQGDTIEITCVLDRKEAYR